MMQNLLMFFVSALTALSVENAVFARGLGLNKWGLILGTARTGALYGLLLTWMATASAILITPVNLLMRDSPYTIYLRAPAYFVCVGAVYALTYLFARNYMKKYSMTVRRALPMSTFNTALFGTLYIAAVGNYGFWQMTGYALGAGVGYTLALLVIFYARKRLAISPVPRAFRGLPILLLYIGLLSLSIYGLIGHGLPS